MTEPTEDTHELHVYLDVMSGCYRWVLRSEGREILARSTRCYIEKTECLSEAKVLELRYPGIMLRDLSISA